MPEACWQVQNMIMDILEEEESKAKNKHETEIFCYVQDAGPAPDASTPIPHPIITHLQEIQAAMLSAGISPASFKLDAEH